MSLVWEPLFIGQGEIDRVLNLSRAGPLAGAVQAHVFEVGALVRIQVAIDRIERHDAGKQARLRGPPVDEITLGDEVAADTPADRRLDLGELHVEASGLDARLRRLQISRSLALLTELRVVVFLRGGISFQQPLRALEPGAGQGEPGLRLGDLGLGALEHGLVRARIDHEQQAARIHHRSILEMDRLQVTAHPCANLHRVDGL